MMRNSIIILIYLLLCFVSSQATIQQEKHNLRIRLHLSEELCDEEQMVYMHAYKWTPNKEFCILDSAKVYIGDSIITLSCYIPEAYDLDFIFSKKGPKALWCKVLPNHTFDLYVNEDMKGKYPYYIKGNDLFNSDIDFRKSIIDPLKKKENLLNVSLPKDTTSILYKIKKDSIIAIRKETVAQSLNRIKTTKYPLEAKGHSLVLYVYYQDIISTDSLQSLYKQLKKKYPNSSHFHYGPPYRKRNLPISEKSKRENKMIHDLFMARGEIIPKDTTLNAKLSLRFPTIDKKLIKLDTIQSEYIFVDFWASWCKPCRKETPYIKEAYSKYKDKLRIYAVTLDANREKWQKAIAEDQTEEFIHVVGVSEKNNPNNQIKALGINAIPRNFLLDKQHRIIAKDLRGEELLKTLDKLINKE